MAYPDISELSIEELEDLIKKATLALEAGKAAREVSKDEKKQAATKAIAELAALLGETDGTPDVESIRGILQFTDAQMVENAGLAFRKAFIGLEYLTKVTLDLAYLASK